MTWQCGRHSSSPVSFLMRKALYAAAECPTFVRKRLPREDEGNRKAFATATQKARPYHATENRLNNSQNLRLLYSFRFLAAGEAPPFPCLPNALLHHPSSHFLATV